MLRALASDEPFTANAKLMFVCALAHTLRNVPVREHRTTLCDRDTYDHNP